MQAKPRRLATRTTAIIVIVIVALVVVSSGGVYYYVNYIARSPCASATSGNIKVGFTISLTGTYNVEGGKSLAGIQAAASWINDNGGVTVNGKARNITLDYYDDQSSSTLVPQLYTKIITQDCAQFLLAPYSSALTGAAAPLAEQYNRVMLSHGGSSDTIWTHGYQNVFGVLSPASTYFKNAIDWLVAVGNNCDLQPGHGPGGKHPMVWSKRDAIRQLLLEAVQCWIPNLPLWRSRRGCGSAGRRDPDRKQHGYDKRQAGHL